MSDPIHDFLDSPDGTSPSLLDRWLAEDLPEDEHLALTARLLGSPRLRELATAALVVPAGLAARQAPLAVVVRRLDGLLRVVRSALRPLPAPAVAVRSGAAPAARSERFSLEPLAPGASLRIAAADDGYRLSIEGGREPEVDWFLSGDEGLRHATQTHGGAVDLAAIPGGTWRLGREDLECTVLIDLGVEA